MRPQTCHRGIPSDDCRKTDVRCRCFFPPFFFPPSLYMPWPRRYPLRTLKNAGFSSALVHWMGSSTGFSSILVLWPFKNTGIPSVFVRCTSKSTGFSIFRHFCALDGMEYCMSQYFLPPTIVSRSHDHPLTFLCLKQLGPFKNTPMFWCIGQYEMVPCQCVCCFGAPSPPFPIPLLAMDQTYPRVLPQSRQAGFNSIQFKYWRLDGLAIRKDNRGAPRESTRRKNLFP